MKNHLTFVFLFFSISAFTQATQNIYISSRNTHSIKRYLTNGTYLGDFVAPFAGGLSKPQDLFFHPIDGSLIVTGIDNGVILRFNAQNGDFMGSFSNGYTLDRPTKMRIGPDDLIYVSQWGQSQNKVARFDLDGHFVNEFTSTGVPNGCGMDWDSDGNLYVASYGNGQNGSIHRFDPDGHFFGIFINSSLLQGPVGLWQNSDGDWLVEDWTLGKVERFSADGQYLGTFISGLQNLEGHAFDASGNLYLCDWSGNVVNRYLPNGTFVSEFINSGGLASPNSIIFGPEPGTVSSSNTPSKNSTDIQLFPNPILDSFKINAPFLAGKKTLIQLYTMDGKLVLNESNATSPAKWEFSASGLANGTYLCKVWADGKLVWTNTVAKQ